MAEATKEQVLALLAGAGAMPCEIHYGSLSGQNEDEYRKAIDVLDTLALLDPTATTTHGVGDMAWETVRVGPVTLFSPLGVRVVTRDRKPSEKLAARRIERVPLHVVHDGPEAA